VARAHFRRVRTKYRITATAATIRTHFIVVHDSFGKDAGSYRAAAAEYTKERW